MFKYLAALFFSFAVNTCFAQSSRTEPAAIEKLSRALQFKTVSHTSTDSFIAKPFLDFINWVTESYPLVKKNLGIQVINKYSLVYSWTGTDPALLPGLFSAHYDVVPDGETDLIKWIKPPFSGETDSEFIWGRGALDNKSHVIGLLESIESLLKENFTPKRTLYFAFGHDEEVGGTQGAMQVSEFFTTMKLHFEFVLDEGGAMMKGVFPGLEKTIAFIGAAEKGYLNLELIAEDGGGHSSVPPPENSIDILAKAVTRLNNNPMPARLASPTVEMLNIMIPYVDFKTRIAIRHRGLFGGKILKKLKKNEATNAIVRTTITPTIIHGGIKENSLPRSTSVNLNVRMLPGDSLETILSHVKQIIKDDRVSLHVKEPYYNASGITSTNSVIWKYVDNSIRSVFPGVIPVPFLFPATTDSHHYREISETILRFDPVVIDEQNKNSFHGMNERISIEQFMKVIRFYTHLLKSM